MKKPASWLKKHHRIMGMMSKLGLTAKENEDLMRHVLFEATGKHSRANLNEHEQLRLIVALEKMLPKEIHGKPRGTRERSGNVIEISTQDQRGTIRAIFDLLQWNDERIAGLLLRVTRQRAHTIDTLIKPDASKLLEVLKSIQAQTIKHMIKDLQIDETLFCDTHFNCATVEQINKTKFGEAINILRAMNGAHSARRVHNELNDDDVYKISELTQNQFRNLFPVSQETVERWCRDGVFPGAFKFKSTDKAEWMITGRDFKYYFKTQYQLFV